MKEHTRPVVAAIAASAINGKKYSSVYDYSRSAYFSISTKVQGNRVDCYDYTNSAFIQGTLPSSVYHYGDGGFLEIKVSGNKFSGHDYHTGTFHQGTVRGNSVELYDFGSRTFYNFQLS